MSNSNLFLSYLISTLTNFQNDFGTFFENYFVLNRMFIGKKIRTHEFIQPFKKKRKDFIFH